MEPFVKTILPASFGYSDPLCALVDVHSRGIDSSWMSKRAAAGVFRGLDIKPEKGHSFIHLIAMGDAEAYGFNRNGDGFLKQSRYVDIPNPKDGKTRRVKIAKGNIETHKTFEKFAKVYRHHVNKDPKKAEGDVFKSAHNDAMSRVELMIKVVNDKWGNEIQKLASGEDVPFSMSCKVPFDVCTECGNKAKSRKEYCDHAKNHMGEITKQGNNIGVLNDHMLYFDISEVTVPADRIAFGLLKAASDDSRIVSGSELSEQFTLFPPVEAPDPLYGGPVLTKLSMIGKLADIEKDIEAVADAGHPINRTILAFDPDAHTGIDDDDMRRMDVPRGQVHDLLGSLADAKISLSLRDFLKIILGRRFGEVENHVEEASDLLPGIFGRIAAKPMGALSDLDDFDLGDGILPRAARDTICKLIPGNSLDDEPVRRRVTITILRGKSPLKMKGPLELEKRSEVAASPLAERMATAYAMYKVAFCQRVGMSNRVLTERAVLQHYIPGN